MCAAFHLFPRFPEEPPPLPHTPKTYGSIRDPALYMQSKFKQTRWHKHTHANSEVWLKLRKVVRSRPGLAGAGERKQVLISLVSFQGKDSELNITWTWCVYAEARQRPEAMFNQSGFKLNQRMAPEYC